MTNKLGHLPWFLIGAAGGTLLGFFGIGVLAYYVDMPTDPQWDGHAPTLSVVGGTARMDLW